MGKLEQTISEGIFLSRKKFGDSRRLAKRKKKGKKFERF
jgi:hypothetical protein